MLYAAVVIPIVRYDEPTIVFVRRAAHLRRNPGEIGFPGGVIEPDDADARAAALREFEEELGVDRERVHVVDRLPDVVTLALSATVTPYLGLLEPPVRYALDQNETQDVYEIPLAALYAPRALHHGIERVVRDGREFDVPSWLFDYGSVHVWGATARMLHDLVARYRTTDDLLART
ncbi:MAG: CoA pyrophosphatase [Candidatus Eremiobacteraeota bacterium]|nr:CoA pyrophosphatase [Candidatus Eremiobacteraeota bacterium]